MIPKIQINDEAEKTEDNSLQVFNDLDVSKENQKLLSVSKTEIGPILVKSSNASEIYNSKENLLKDNKGTKQSY